jgi:glycosyltransferase involved in cell wall biosynthesis
VPVGSNLPPAADPQEIRAGILGHRDVPILAAFGKDHPSRLLGHVASACRAVAERVGPHVLLNLGSNAAPIPGLPEQTQVLAPGRLADQALADHLACADVVLLPFANGAITNRTTIMAALALGLATVSTRAPLTDAVLIDPGLCLADVNEPTAFARLTADLVGDQPRRTALATAGRALFLREFAWTRIAERTLEALEGAERARLTH